LDDSLTVIIVLFAVAFIPSIIYLVWIRNTEKYSREPYKALLKIFLYGAVLSVLIAAVLEVLLVIVFNQNIERIYELLGEHPSVSLLILVCVIAPFVEEMTKGLAVFRARRKGLIGELENGIVYGAGAGLGFAATENLMYEGTAFFAEGIEAWITIAIVRSLSSALLHATCSSLFGLGIARNAFGQRSWMPYYLGAVAMHSAFNFAASFGVLYYDSIGDLAYLIGLAVALSIAVMGISVMRGKIRRLDKTHRWRG